MRGTSTLGFWRGGLTAAILATTALAAPALAEPQTYEFDPSHTLVSFTVDHMGFSAFPASFRTMSGSATIDPDNLAASTVTATIDATSIDTRVEKLDTELKDEAFKTGEFPEIVFKSTAVEVTGAETARITGDLTLAGQTKPVTLDAKLYGRGKHPFKPAEMLGFQATGSFDRTAFGVTNWSPVVGDTVTVTVSAELQRAVAE